MLPHQGTHTNGSSVLRACRQRDGLTADGKEKNDRMNQKSPLRAPDTDWTKQRIGQCADRLFLYCFLAHTCSYLGRKNLAACIPAMIAEGLVDISGAGYITTAYMVVYCIGQALSGLAASKVKPQYLIGLGLLGAGVCNLAMGLVALPLLYTVIWAFNGLFHAMFWSPIIRVFTDRLPPGRRERAGIKIAISCSVGAVLAYLIPALLLKLGGWRVVFLVSGAVILAVFLMWVIGHRLLRTYIRYMDRICEAERKALQAEAAAHAPTAVSVKKRSSITVFFLAGLWLLLPALFCSGALQDAVESWAPTFLSEQFCLDDSVAVLFSVLIPVFSLLGPFISDTLHRRLLRNEAYTCAVLFAATALCIGGMYLTREVNAFLCACFMAVSVAIMFGTNHMFLTVIPYHFSLLGLSATMSGFLNSAMYLATALFSAIYGMVAEGLGWNVLILVWLCVSGTGVLLSVIGGRLWGKQSQLIDKGLL